MSTEICVPIPHSLTVIKFQESQYTFPERRRVCVTVENMGGPAQTAFAISYSFGMCMANTACCHVCYKLWFCPNYLEVFLVVIVPTTCLT